MLYGEITEFAKSINVSREWVLAFLPAAILGLSWVAITLRETVITRRIQGTYIALAGLTSLWAIAAFWYNNPTSATVAHVIVVGVAAAIVYVFAKALSAPIVLVLSLFIKTR